MKEKTKNILKGLGVGALACFGLFGLTGCSVDLTQEQIDKLVYTVESSDKFMQDAIDLLEKQNAKLNTEQAWDLYKLAQTRFYLNDMGVRDNFQITFNENCIYYYKTSIGDYVHIQNGGSDYLEVVFEQDGMVYDYYKDEEGIYKSELGEGEVEQYIYYDGIPYAASVEVKEEDMVSCDILENGNYKITFLNTWSDDPERYIQTNLVEIEISSDAKFVSERIVSGSHILKGGNHNEDYDVNYYSFDGEIFVSYEYDVLTDEDILGFLEEAKNAQVSTDE